MVFVFNSCRLDCHSICICLSSLLIRFSECHAFDLQVIGAIGQAVQRAPYLPESHNLHGLVCESRTDYQSAIVAYQKARCALRMFPNFKSELQSSFTDVSVNLARSLCKVNYV